LRSDGGKEAEEGEEGWHDEAENVHHLHEELGVGVWVIWGREAVKGDRRVGSSEARDGWRGGGEQINGMGRRGRDGDDDRDVVAEEGLGEIHHGDEVAHAQGGVQHHGRIRS
jgi:hypothetical protein